MKSKIVFYHQFDIADCGPACLRMISKFYGKHYTLEHLRSLCYISKEGVSLLNINDAAEKIGFRTYMAHLTIERLVNDCPTPSILHWNQNHFVVLYRTKKNKNFVIADPAHGVVTLDKETFTRSWISNVNNTGIALLLEPTPQFYDIEDEKNNNSFHLLIKYLKPHKREIFQIIIGMLMASMITLVVPYITKLLIDEGVNKKNINIVYLVLLSQLFLFIGGTAIELLRNWLLLHLNTRLSLNIISDFLTKLLRLPISFFDSKAVGDLSQRITDHHRVDNFLTVTVISSLFSILNILLFSLILCFYSGPIFFTFTFLSVLGILWVYKFQKRRRQLDYKRFARNRENQDKIYELITGMQEIKLHGSETVKRWDWERLQIRFFKLNTKTLALEQWQQSGFGFVNTLKNIVISFIAASEVISGKITLGTLLSISYIIGQTNGPINQLVTFVKSAQDAMLSMNRLQEIYEKDDEDNNLVSENKQFTFLDKDIVLNRVSFQYEGPNSRFVLKDISFCIPKGKVTAIVGSSGSGKSTILKLLLGFYKPVEGEILVGTENLDILSKKLWRSKCGTVMQEGFIFYDTIARNIVMDGKEIDEIRFNRCIEIANLQKFLADLPLGHDTKIGANGIGISGGQKQRILLARAIYKNPEYLLLDEATSSLDANNETQIMNMLGDFFVGRTVLVIAHRLSTVKNADQIIVLENGSIVERGTHVNLTKEKGKYYELVRNQLELG